MSNYKNIYCEWKYKEVLDTDNKGRAKKWLLKSDCQQEIIATRDNKYGLILKQLKEPNDQTKCPFCNKEIDIRCYD